MGFIRLLCTSHKVVVAGAIATLLSYSELHENYRFLTAYFLRPSVRIPQENHGYFTFALLGAGLNLLPLYLFDSFGFRHIKNVLSSIYVPVMPCTAFGTYPFTDAQILDLRILATADVAAIPSHINEALGMTCIEAVAMGLPVIATNDGGIPETLVNQKHILVNKDKDLADNLAKAVLQIKNNYDKYIGNHLNPEFTKESYSRRFFDSIIIKNG